MKIWHFLLLGFFLLYGCSYDYSSCLANNIKPNTVISDIKCVGGTCGTPIGKNVNKVLLETGAKCVDGKLIHPDGRLINFTNVNCCGIGGIPPNAEIVEFCNSQKEEIKTLESEYYFIYLPCYPCCPPP